MSTPLIPSPGALFDADTVPDADTEVSTLDDIGVAPATPATFLAEVVANGSEARPGRVHCMWRLGGHRTERWLPIVRGVAARPFDRVLCMVVAGSPEPIVTAIVDGLAGGPARPAASSPRLRLDADEALCIASADGTPLIEVRAGDGRVHVSVLQHQTEVALAGPLHLSATDVTIEARQGDLKLVANGDAVVEAEIIHLN